LHSDLLLLLPLVLGPLLVCLLFRNSQLFLLLCYADKYAIYQARGSPPDNRAGRRSKIMDARTLKEIKEQEEALWRLAAQELPF